MLIVVAEPIVPFASRVMVIVSPVVAYKEFSELVLVIVNVSIPSGFASTVTILFT